MMCGHLTKINCNLFSFLLFLSLGISSIQMFHVSAFTGHSLKSVTRLRFRGLQENIYFRNVMDNGGKNQNWGLSMAMSMSTSSYWERLNAPKSVMAPMVAQSDLPFRRLCRDLGTDLCFTQMIHAGNFVQSELFQDAQLDVYGVDKEIVLSHSGVNALKGLEEDISFKGVPLDELLAKYQSNDDVKWNRYQEGRTYHNPLIVQLAGHDTDAMTESALIILKRTGKIENNLYTGPVSGIDINCGCPQGIARKGRYGAFLMEEDVDIVCNIIQNLKKNLPTNVGVSCKMRIPQDVGLPRGDAVLKERICKLIDAGVDLLTIHGRTLKENKTKVKECNWDAISQVVKLAREYSNVTDFPVIANGGIEFSSDVERCLKYTGASAVMSSEALLENPGIFAENAKDDGDLSPKEMFQRQMKYCRDYVDLSVVYPPIPGSLGKEGGAFNCMRSHIFKFIYRYLMEHPDLRDRLAHNTETITIQHARDILDELEQRYNSINDDEWERLSSFNAIKSSWYRRHRDAKLNSKMRIRGQKVKSELSDLSLADKKELLRERIKKMKERRGSTTMV